MRNQLRFIGYLTLLLMSASCAGDDLSLADEVLPGDPRFDRLRERLGITIESGGTGTGATGCTASRCDPVAFVDLVRNACELAVDAEFRTTGTCGDGTIDAAVRICVANRLLTVAETAAPIDVPLAKLADSAVTTTMIGAQDGETNHELARLALAEAASAVRLVAARVDPAVYPSCSTSSMATYYLGHAAGAIAPLSSTTIIEELAQQYREGLELLVDAARLLEDAGMAVSDAERSRATDAAEASLMALADVASRTASAHTLVGGSFGLPGSAPLATAGFFARPPLSAEGAEALRLIREAAPSPALIADADYTVENLIVGSGGVSTANSLSERLGRMYNREPMRTAGSAATFYEGFSSSEAAFIEARAYLEAEISAFDRSAVNQLEPERLGDGSLSSDHGIVLYAGTRNPPAPLPPTWWSALVRYDASPPAIVGGSTSYASPPAWLWRPTATPYYPPGYTYGDESVVSSGGTSPVYVSVGAASGVTAAAALDEAFGYAPTIISRLCTAGNCAGQPDAFEDAVATISAAVVDALPQPTASGTSSLRYGTASYMGRARACWFQVGSERVRVDVEVSGLAAADIRVVNGREGLECAVRGTIDGAPCSQAVFDSFLNGATFSGTTVLTAEITDVDYEPRLGVDAFPFFVVRRREGLSSMLTPAPGQFEELTGFILRKPTSGSGYRYCLQTVIAPGLDRAVQELVEPNPHSLREFGTSCAGLPSNMAIPLENELTSDGDAAESSWRHYLELARRASTEADLLGEELIRTGMEMDLRAEAASDELSRLCGVSINLTSLSALLADHTEYPPTAAPIMGVCTPPHVLRGDTCVLDVGLVAALERGTSPDLDRLATCLGTDAVPWVALGDTPLCMWDTTPDAAGGICEGRSTEYPCPSVHETTGACAQPLPPAAPVGTVRITVDDLLGMFGLPDDLPPDPPDPTDLPCVGLARLRAGDLTLSDLAELLGSAFLTQDGFATYARNLRWDASVNDFSSVRFAGGMVWRTGMGDTESLGWPTGAPVMGVEQAPPGSCPSESWIHDPANYTGPLFCIDNLNSAIARSRMNDLLARAVIAARIVSGTGMDDMVLPYYPPNGAMTFDDLPETFTWDAVGTSTNVFCSSTGTWTVDHSEFDGTDGYERSLSDLGSRACYVMGETGPAPCSAHPTGAEWTRCPYEGFGCDVFDIAPDCDEDPNDLDLPFVAHTVGDELNVPGALPAAISLWRGRMPSLLGGLLLAAGSRRDEYLRTPFAPLATIRGLTRYYEPGGCWGSPSYEDCVGEGRVVAVNNMAAPGASGTNNSEMRLTRNDVMNALELTCWAARSGLPPSDTSCAEPSDITGIADAERMAAYMECRANEISADAGRSVIADLPAGVVDALRASGPRAYGESAGEIAAQLAEIRAAMFELRNVRSSMASDIRAYSASLRALRARVAMSENAARIEELASMGRALDRTVQCVTATAEASTTDIARAAAGIGAAVATCVGSALHIVWELQAQELRRANVEESLIDEFGRFDEMSTRVSNALAERSNLLQASLQRIDGALTRIRSAQQAARRALARALYLSTDDAGAHFAVNDAYRARYSTALSRYRSAHTRAVRAAYIARLSLEQRLGMPLTSISDDVFSDEPPSEWVDTLCTLSSIDYDRVRGTSGDDATPADYSGLYVGDYVRRLEDVFESYSFVYPFREGIDTAVISLRDDIFRSRAPCDVPSPNLLLNGSRLDVVASWRIEGCNVAAVPAPDGGRYTDGSLPERRCLTVEPASDVTGETVLVPDEAYPSGGPYEADVGTLTGYRVAWFNTPASSTETRLVQTVDLGPGRYRLSWYGRDVSGGGVEAEEAVLIGVLDDFEAVGEYSMRRSEPIGGGWARYWQFVTVPEPVSVDVMVAILFEGSPTGRAVDIAGVMLEDVTDSVTGNPDEDTVDALVTTYPVDGGAALVAPGSIDLGEYAAPGPFVESGSTGLRTIENCPDTTGAFFRRQAFLPGCVRVCPDGYDGDCSAELAENRCFQEVSFNASSDWLTRVLTEGDAGFAAGNYNYRIESVAVNLVGTSLRDCEARGGSAGCYASGAFAYSVYHDGPYLVRNALGGVYAAPLFPGRLESARALAAERYITNPISGADRSLIEPYTRLELRGRPLGGGLTIRLWEDPGLVFENLEDIQVVLTYRYWTRQE